MSKLMQITKTIFFALLANLFVTAPAWALQTHAQPEGICVHQMAHILFICALAYLYWDIRRTSFSGRGWKFMQLFCILMLCWNIIAFTGHALEYDFDVSEFYHEAGYWHARLLGPITGVKLVYYLAKLDHFVCVPALFFLYLSLRMFYRDSIAEESRETTP